MFILLSLSESWFAHVQPTIRFCLTHDSTLFNCIGTVRSTIWLYLTQGSTFVRLMVWPSSTHKLTLFDSNFYSFRSTEFDLRLPVTFSICDKKSQHSTAFARIKSRVPQPSIHTFLQDLTLFDPWFSSVRFIMWSGLIHGSFMFHSIEKVRPDSVSAFVWSQCLTRDSTLINCIDPVRPTIWLNVIHNSTLFNFIELVWPTIRHSWTHNSQLLDPCSTRFDP